MYTVRVNWIIRSKTLTITQECDSVVLVEVLHSMDRSVWNDRYKYAGWSKRLRCIPPKVKSNKTRRCLAVTKIKAVAYTAAPRIPGSALPVIQPCTEHEPRAWTALSETVRGYWNATASTCHLWRSRALGVVRRPVGTSDDTVFLCRLHIHIYD